MTHKFLTFIIIFLAAVAQVSLAPNLFPGASVPDIALVLVIIWAARQNFESFWLWAVGAGLILDVVSLGTIGISAVSFLVIAFATSFLSKRFFVVQKGKSFFWMMILVLLGTSVNYFLTGGLIALQGASGADIFGLKEWLLKILDNFIVLMIVYWPLIRSKRIFPIEDTRLIVR